jgi:EAL domain-containing protein (putative c-di-GMP-specific phosphodiesterase class I)
LSVNCSPSLMDRYASMEILRLPRLAQKHGIELWVEVVESDPLSFDGSLLLAELESLGAKIALDDYGVAHSNYLRLMEIPASIIKLDVRMLRSARSSARSSARAFFLLRDLVGYLQRRDIQIVAEGVEDEIDITMASRLAVDYQQGYAHGRPARI